MDVILSWSGTQSRMVAKAFREWLGSVLPGIKPWISTEDIAVGTRWFPSLMTQLETTATCILCLTPRNVRSPWLYFEAGAIAGKRDGALVCSYLVGVSGSQLMAGPLSQFQWAEANKEGTWKLLRDINRRLATPHSETLLEGNFDTKWPLLKRSLDIALTEDVGSDGNTGIETLPVKDRYELTAEAEKLLLEASQDKGGDVFMTRTARGFGVNTNGKQLAELNDARCEASWRAAIRLLLQARLLESRGTKGESFAVTAEGYRIADELRSKNQHEPLIANAV